MKSFKKYLIWFFITLAVFMVSVFMHECGHGLANSIAGIPCSTGFDRVGDIYKFPSADDFRSFYSTAEPVLFDFGVPCTLVLSAVVVTVASLTVVLISAIKRKISRINVYAILAFFVFGFGMVLANVLDRYVRINWPGM